MRQISAAERLGNAPLQDRPVALILSQRSAAPDQMPAKGVNKTGGHRLSLVSGVEWLKTEIDMSAKKVARAGGRRAKAQYAALPWRAADDGLREVLLITSRESRRWVIPKGWPIKGLPPELSAAREAFEEAGVTGCPATAALGEYKYVKRLAGAHTRRVQVTVFALEVIDEAERWPEQTQRERRWVSPEQAADLVGEQDLKMLIRGFAAEAS